MRRRVRPALIRIARSASVALVGCVASVLICISHAYADGKLTDSDGAFDVTDMLLNHRGVLPVPTIISEPAVGYGRHRFSLSHRSQARLDDGHRHSARTGSERILCASRKCLAVMQHRSIRRIQ